MATTIPTSERSLDDVVRGLRFAVVATSTAGAIDGRPLTLLEQDGAVLRFLVSIGADWVVRLDGGDPVLVAFADPGSNTYVSLRGTATLSDDRDLVERLWNPAAGVYFDGKDDPEIAVLEVEVTGGEWWDGPSSKVGQAVSMLRTKVTGHTAASQHGDVEV